MNTEKQHIEHLVTRKITGDITSEELKELFTWVEASPDNADLYIQLIKVLGAPQIEKARFSVNRKMQEKAKLQTAVKKNKLRFLTSKLSRVAAVLIAVVLIPLALGKYAEDEQGNGLMHSVRANDLTTSFYLPDGSRVTLARGSVMTYSDDFSCKNREVELEGKAYIEISESCQKMPVVINSGSKCTVSKNGSLYIDSSKEQLNVAVEKGTATVIDTIYKKVIMPAFKLQPALKPGEVKKETNDVFSDGKLVAGENMWFDGQGEKTRSTITNECEVFAWKDRVFCFNDLKQHELAFRISEWYGKKVELKGIVSPVNLYSGKFKEPSVEALVKEVFETEFMSIKETKKKITITLI